VTSGSVLMEVYALSQRLAMDAVRTLATEFELLLEVVWLEAEVHATSRARCRRDPSLPLIAKTAGTNASLPEQVSGPTPASATAPRIDLDFGSGERRRERI